MANQLPPVRRIVTAINKDGKAYIKEDGGPNPAAVRQNPARPGFVVSNLWATSGSPAPLNSEDLSPTIKGIMPPRSGTVIKTIDYPPYSKQRAEAESRQGFISSGGHGERGVRRVPGRHPGFHETDSIDYAIVLFGEMVALVDEGEVTMKAGDVLIHRGTSHAWENRSDQPARILFVLVDGTPNRDK